MANVELSALATLGPLAIATLTEGPGAGATPRAAATETPTATLFRAAIELQHASVLRMRAQDLPPSVTVTLAHASRAERAMPKTGMHRAPSASLVAWTARANAAQKMAEARRRIARQKAHAAAVNAESNRRATASARDRASAVGRRVTLARTTASLRAHPMTQTRR
jgi:hypothetical protein